MYCFVQNRRFSVGTIADFGWREQLPEYVGTKTTTSAAVVILAVSASVLIALGATGARALRRHAAAESPAVDDRPLSGK